MFELIEPRHARVQQSYLQCTQAREIEGENARERERAAQIGDAAPAREPLREPIETKRAVSAHDLVEQHIEQLDGGAISPYDRLVRHMPLGLGSRGHLEQRAQHVGAQVGERVREPLRQRHLEQVRQVLLKFLFQLFHL